MTWQDLVKDALVEINVLNPNDPLEADDLQQGQRRLNRILDSWAAQKVFAFSQSFPTYNLTPNHSPYLLGPGLTTPDWPTPNAGPRPFRLPAANLILNDQSPAVDLPLTPRDRDWWMRQQVKNLATAVPTDFFYSPDETNGSVILWPIGNFAYGVRLEIWTEVGQAPPDMTEVFTAPQGYPLAATLTLAEHSCTPYQKPVPGDLVERARVARSAVIGNNANSPRIMSADYGTRGRRKNRADFNYYTGGPSNGSR